MWLMGREIVSWEGGARLGGWGLERSGGKQSVEFLCRLCAVGVLRCPQKTVPSVHLSGHCFALAFAAPNPPCQPKQFPCTAATGGTSPALSSPEVSTSPPWSDS